MATVNGLCEECAKHGIIKAADIVHHIIELDDEKARDPEFALNFDNLEAVCIECHNKLHYGKNTPKRYRIINGDLVIGEDAPPDRGHNGPRR